MTTVLQVSDELDLPLDFVTESNAILGKKGSGKTNAGLVMLEEIHRAGAPVVTIDPKGDHWGVRAGRSGTPAGGLPIVVFGGLHGDIPLEPTSGVFVANLLRERRLSAVLDVSEFSVGERRKFLTAFADRLYRYPSKDVMHLLLEEAHEYVPQFVKGDDAAMVGVFERIVKLGRNKGLGVTMVSQRSASLNKNVLSQVDNLFVLRTGAPQDRAAVLSWISSNADAREIVDALPKLLTGECWLWQPARGEPVHFRFRMRNTFDAGVTPKLGEDLPPAATLADINLGEIETLMRDTVEKSKADDPAELRRQLAERNQRITVLEGDRDVLEGKLDAALIAARPAPIDVVIAHVPAVFIDRLEKLRGQLLEAHKFVSETIDEAREINGRSDEAAVIPAPAPISAPKQSENAMQTLRERVLAPSTAGDIHLGPYERKLLSVLAQYPNLSTKQIAMRSGYSSKSSAFGMKLAALRREGFIAGDGRTNTITDAGREVLGDIEPLPTGQALIDHWLRTLKPTEANILRMLIEQWPASSTTAEISAATGYSMTSSSFGIALASLKKWELAYGTKDAMFAVDELGEARTA